MAKTTKSVQSLNIASSIINSVEGVTKEWAKQRKAEERSRSAQYRRDDAMLRSSRVTIVEAAFDYMEDAYDKASDFGRLPVRPRQIMYAIRPKILEVTGNDHLDDRYFTQTILPDYINAASCEDWDIVWDARGHFREPHTRHEVGLGTLEVREYLGLRVKREDAITVDRAVLYPTLGPEHRFDTVLFIEKEGFGPLFEAERMAERYDLAIMSTKGMSVTAARMLLDHLMDRGVTRILALHDFDVSGFSIFGTLGTDSRRYQFDNSIAPIDIGLRLNDVRAMNVESEPFRSGKDWNSVSRTLRRHGATPEEIAFLQNRRVELNAMTSPQLIAFIEDKLAGHGVEKVIPDATTLEEHARRIIKQDLAAAAVEKLQKELDEQAAAHKVPKTLLRQVRRRLEQDSTLSWDQALAAIFRKN